MGQDETLEIIEKYGDLENDGSKLTIKQIHDIYKKEYTDVCYNSICKSLLKLRQHNIISFEYNSKLPNSIFYWKK